MRGGTGPAPTGASAAEQITAIVKSAGDWRGTTLSQLRTSIRETDPRVVEEVKWKKPSNPLGVPVWSLGGIVCIGNVLKSAVRLTFPKGVLINDPKQLFNARLDSGSVRAIDFHAGDVVDETAFRALIIAAVGLNTSARQR